MDSVSLIFLMKVPELISLTKTYFEKFYVTDLVYAEVFENKFSEELGQMDKITFERKNPKKILQLQLGKGESSAISLAMEEDLYFISEDRKAILFANGIGIGIKTVSLLSILVKARKADQISKEEAKKLLFNLIKNDFYLSSELLVSILKEIENYDQ